MIKLYNTATRTKEEFKPIDEGKVRMYVCGVTVYDHCHIGHARSTVVFDAIVRYLEHLGLEVTYVRNFTDVDDKIISRANEQGRDIQAVTGEFIASFKEDMDALGVRQASFEPRATDYIPEIIQAVAGLVEKGAAYESEGDVYFSVPDFKPYGSLSKRNIDDLLAGARVGLGDKKKNHLDFALWKNSKPGEPAWDSPWGQGRPGWHIECSAMSAKLLGLPFDIHGGGEDLIFPHHENEKAQAEALSGGEFVKYWLHNGFVRIDEEKMSKSLGNFLTIKEILNRYHPQALRLFLLSAHYRSPLDYSEEAMAEADEGISRLFEAWGRALEANGAGDGHPAQGPLAELAAETRAEFDRAMDNDVNTAQALGHLFNLARAINRALAGEEGKNGTGGLAAARDTLKELCNVLGLLEISPAQFAEERQALLLSRDSLDEAEIEKLIAARTQARQDKNFAEADRIRDELSEQGVILFDSPEGTTWKLKG